MLNTKYLHPKILFYFFLLVILHHNSRAQEYEYKIKLIDNCTIDETNKSEPIDINKEKIIFMVNTVLDKDTIKSLKYNDVNLIAPSGKNNSDNSIKYFELKKQNYPGKKETLLNLTLETSVCGTRTVIIPLKEEVEVIDEEENEGKNEVKKVTSCFTSTKCEAKTSDGKFSESPNYYNKYSKTIIYDFRKKEKYLVYKTYPKKTNRKEKLNFNNGTLTCKKFQQNRDYIGSKDDLQFKVVNVNRMLYNVSITDTTKQYFSEPTFLFNEFFLGDNEGFLGDIIQLLKTDYAIPERFDAEKTQLDKLESSMKNFLAEYHSLKYKLLDYYTECVCYEDCNSSSSCLESLWDSYKMVHAEFEAFKANYDSDLKTYQTLNTNIESCISDNNKKILLDETISELTDESREYTLAKDAAKSADEKKMYLEFIKENKATLTKLRNERKELNVCSTIDIAKDEKKRDSIAKNLEPFNKINAYFQQLPNISKLDSAIILYKNQVRSSTEFSKDFINTRDAHEIELYLNIIPYDTASYFGIPQGTKNEKINLLVLPKSFVSFSSGFFVAPDGSLTTKEYKWQAVPINNQVLVDSNQYVLTESGYSEVPMGFSALGNFQYKFQPKLGIGLSVGVGLTLEENPRLAYLGGGSVFFGKNRQFILTAGACLMNVDKLKKEYEYIYENKIRYEPNGTPAKIEYYKKMETGFVFSITYTPFRLQ